MQIYNYDSSGFYIGASLLNDSDRDPLMSDTFLIPSNATAIAPPTVAEKQTARWLDDQWTIVPDLVGTIYYLDGIARAITERGVGLPDGATLDKPATLVATELADYKKAKVTLIQDMASTYQARIVGTSDPAQESRYAQNVAAALRVLNNTADQHDLTMLQEQLDACNQVNKAGIAGKSLLEFATWIDTQWQLIRRANGAIEALKVRGTAFVQSAGDKEAVDQVLAQLSQQAEMRYQELLTTGH